MSRAETSAARFSVAARDPANGTQAKRGVPRAPRRPRRPGRSRRPRGDPPELSGEARARLMAGPRLPCIPPLNSSAKSVRSAVGFRGRIGVVEASDDQLHLLAHGLAVDLRARQRLGQLVLDEEDFLSGVHYDLIARSLVVQQESEPARGGRFEAQADVGIADVHRGLDLGQHIQRALRHLDHHALLSFTACPARAWGPGRWRGRSAGAVVGPRPPVSRPHYWCGALAAGAGGWIGGITSMWVAMFLPSRTSYEALTCAPSDTSMSVPLRPSTWTCVSVFTESVLLNRPNQPVATRTVPSVRSTFFTWPSSEPAAGTAG